MVMEKPFYWIWEETLHIFLAIKAEDREYSQLVFPTQLVCFLHWHSERSTVWCYRCLVSCWVAVACFTIYNCCCRFELVENVPYDLPFEVNTTAAKPLYQAWISLLDIAQENIHVASYYWSLTGKDINVNDSSSEQVGDNQWQAHLWLYISRP